jgi:FdhD protein
MTNRKMTVNRTASFVVTRVAPVAREVFDDVVAIEEPLEIIAAWRAGGEPREKNISVTMRTPGDDFDLAAGFLFTEGLLSRGDEIGSIRHWSSPNRVRVALSGESSIDTSRLDRHFFTTSSCGVCGKTSIDALRVSNPALPSSAPIDGAIITSIPKLLQDAQTAFVETGGVHGAAIIDRGGALLRVREDVGRHNAVDKVIGSFVRKRCTESLAASMLVVSSRASFEIVQKAIVATIPAVVSIGAPSSLAIDLAREFNVTLVGFVREGRFNVYAGEVA